MPKTIELNHFVLRQTAQSRFSHFEPRSGNPADTWSELEALIASRFPTATRFASEKDVPFGFIGTRLITLRDDGNIVKLVLDPEDAEGFFSGVVRANDATVFKTVCAPRANALPGELPFIHSTALNGKKSAAVVVEVILYHVSAMTEKDLTYTPAGATEPVVQDGEWQVVSVNARDTLEPEPQTPQAMARNTAAHFGLPEGEGGTPRLYTAEEFMRSILYWSDRTMATGS